MMKTFVKLLAFTTLAFGTVSVAQAQSLPPGTYHPDPDNPDWLRTCDATACLSYWNVGGDNWVLVKVEPVRPPGGRHEN